MNMGYSLLPLGHDKVISNDMFHAESVPEGEKLEALMAERADVKADEVNAVGS